MAGFISKIIQSKITKNIVVILMLAVVLIFLTSVYVKIYTHHGQTILTPSFKGLTLKQAQEMADDKRIKLQIIDSVFEGYGAPGTIVDQTPKANFQIKKNRTIFIVIKALTQRMVKMPNLNDVSLIQAQALLESNGLLIGKISYIANPNYPHLVMAQEFNGKDIQAGKMIPVGSKIDLLVGEVGNSTNSVPDLTGMSYNEALSEISGNYMNIGKVYFSSSIVTQKDTAEAIVYKQSPDAGYTLNYGDKVDIWLDKEN